MTRIIPIKELKNTAKLSDMVHESCDPVFVTRNGYADMVIMSTEAYDESLFVADVSGKVYEAEQAIENGDVIDAAALTDGLRKKHEL